jgi:hypothetical protein
MQGGTVTRKSMAVSALAGVLLFVVASTSGVAQTMGEKVHIEAFAVNMSNIGTGSNGTVMIDVDRWSTPEEREMLINTMLQHGQDALLSALQKAPTKGRMWFPNVTGPDPTQARLGYPVRYAFQTPLPEGGRRIVIALDRYITFWEARNQPRSFNYPFTLIQIEVDRNGQGNGKMSVATKINFQKAKNVIELENYASEPVRLQNVKVEVKK